MNTHIRNKLDLLPDKPGCYLMKNEEGAVIYVGKAKVLKNRVRSYFSGSHNIKTQRMVGEIADFEYIVTASSMEALILECNLIKQHHPRYNVLLKDDKSFPYIRITSEPHPRLEVTRKVIKGKGKYFGPYPSAYSAQETKKLLDRLYPLRKCRTMPDRACLYYHLNQCLAPCQFEVPEDEYVRMSAEIIRFLNGGHGAIRRELEKQMHEAAEELNFERAKELRDQILHIDAVMEKQTITTIDVTDRDIFGYHTAKGWMCVQILYMRQGKMIERKATVFPYYGEAYDDFLSFVSQYYSDNPALPREILLPQPEAAAASAATEAAQETAESEEEQSADVRMSLQSWLKVKVYVPRRGAKSKMVKMACDNAVIALEEKFKLIEREQERTWQAVGNLADRLGMASAGRIEAFDNSNIQGTAPVSAMVVFTNGKPDRKEYRKYKVRTVQGPDDYGTMREVVRRRYERVLKEGLPLPDLVVVDGGKGQITAVTDVLENELNLDIRVCGLVKDTKHKTAQLMAGDPPEVVDLPRDSQEFYLLQRIQDEVHRFALAFHRQTRGKNMITSRLDEVPGIGEKRRKALLRHFGSLKKMKEAAVEDFRPLGIGEKLARAVLMELNGDQEYDRENHSMKHSPDHHPEAFFVDDLHNADGDNEQHNR